MKQAPYLLLLLLLSSFTAACGGGESELPGTVQGPALIMFYTDG